jgi:uncharacterized protein YecE (DUF72 family)
MARVQGEIRIGISGWRYKGWRGKFYPKKLRQKDELHYAAEHFPTIEINGTFYSLQSVRSFEQWCVETPEDFVFAVKGSRFITHILRLRDVRQPLATFFAQGLLVLGKKLGPLLWQLPPNFKFDRERLAGFFELLPRDLESAAELATRRNRKIVPKAYTKIERNRPLRHALEVRHGSFRTPEFIELLRRYQVALVCADTVEWPRLMDLTADFVYCRLHGSQVLYASGYDAKSIADWARRTVDWAEGREPEDAERVMDRGPKRAARDVYVYFDNDAKVRAPADAMAMEKKVEELGSERSFKQLHASIRNPRRQ